MSYIYKRGKYFWVGYKLGGKAFQKSLNVTSRDAAKILLAEYQILEARERHRSTLLIVKKNIDEAGHEFVEDGDRTHRAKETVRERKGSLNRFKAHIKKSGISRPDEITCDLLERYYHDRMEQTLAGANKDLKVIKAFLSFCMRKGYCRDNPALQIKKIAPVKKIFRDMSFDEMGTLLMVAMHLHPHLYFARRI